MRATRGGISANDLDRGVPLSLQKEITSALGGTLGTHSALPVQQDLSDFFSRAERVVDGISPKFTKEHLYRPQLEKIAPLLLGQATWEAVEKRDFDDWDSFKKAVNRLYGLSR